MKIMKRLSSILIVVTILFASCGKKTAPEVANTPQADTTIYLVNTIILEKQQVAQVIEYTANLLAYEEINYAPASPGRIETINVEVGSRVAKGDIIAEMDKTQLLQAKEGYLNARWTFERMDTLHNQNSISEQQYEGAKVQYENAKTSYEFLLRNTTLRSPVNGIVTGKYFESGELYSAVPNTASGKAAIVTLMQISPLKAQINISEKYFPLVKKGMVASVGVDIFPNQKFRGEVFRVYPTINADTRTFAVELVINNPNEILRPGMFTRVSLDLGEINTLVVPAIAVVKQEGTNERFVFLVNEDSTASKIFVEIAGRYDDKLELISDKVKEGSQLIIAGQDKLINGSRISIKK
jgi:membrane fusion protein (multidrug efflux system)